MAALDYSYAYYVEINGGEFCGICGVGPNGVRKLDRDHCHKSGLPRGLLCRKHNRFLASWVTADLLRAAADYLDR